MKIKEGGGMDKEREREAFEKECRLLCYKGNMVMSNLGSFYNNEQTNWMWQMWLSAKAQAVPEGFVVVPIAPILKILDAASSLAPIKTMIAASQEPAND